ncbi:MAG: hypothetical protein C5B53_01525 [Candidatus Melainabacteria bacterium]|nr:MAG: hypothetical protein C5B53_01525 [Candidatus Melainabacteria bacterium]
MTTIIRHKPNGLASRILRESRERKLLLTIIVTLPTDFLERSNQDLNPRALVLTGAVASCESILDPSRKMGTARAATGDKSVSKATIDKLRSDSSAEK